MVRAKQYADRQGERKWPFARIVERNGRIIRDHIWVDGRDEHHPEGRYYLEWYEDGKRRRKAVESYDLLLPVRAKSIELNAVKAGLIALPEAAVASVPPF